MTLQEQVEQFERQARRADDKAKAELLANCSQGIQSRRWPLVLPYAQADHHCRSAGQQSKKERSEEIR